jgi:hypothetical protein
MITIWLARNLEEEECLKGNDMKLSNEQDQDKFKEQNRITMIEKE